MKALYLDLISGLSGDMFLGALVDLGADPSRLLRQLAKLDLDDYHLHFHRQAAWHIWGTKVDVHLEGPEPAPDHDHPHHHGHPHHHHAPGTAGHHRHAHAHEHSHTHEAHGRSFAQIRQLIKDSRLSPWVRTKAVAIFQRLAVAEGKVHHCPPDDVHFHEVGAVDSIVDIVGACVGLELLGKPRVLASTVTEGRGWVECAHGRFPVPVPATLEILAARGVTLEQCEEPHELVTPTGAALLAELVEHFGPMPPMKAMRVGYGLGTRKLSSRPNCVRAVLGELNAPARQGTAPDWESDQVAVVETNLDDLNPEILGQFVEKALNQGALDVYYTPVTMKKNRPGVLLTLLCPAADVDTFAALILRETSAFGVRYSVATRRKLQRSFEEVSTPWGQVQIKVGRLEGKVVQTAPEFESCRQVAEEKGVPVRQVYNAALALAANRTASRKRRRSTNA